MATGNIFPIKQQNVGTGGRFVTMYKVPGYVAAFWAMCQ